jgi:hypothetical protein
MPSRRSPLLALVVLALAACADPVSPRPSAPNARQRVSLAVLDNSTFPVTFTLSAALCGLPADVTGTGVFHAVFRATQSKNGEWRISFTSNASGTATGADGSTYRFNYANAGTWVDPVDPNTPPEVIEIVDHFNLLGQGQTPDLRVFLKGRFRADTFEPVDNPVVRGPDIFCDPI